jgi:hypothetical protein
MIIVFVAVAASALLGLAAGLVFRVRVHALLVPLIALGSAPALASHGFDFLQGVLVTFACLFVSQLAYLIAAFLATPVSLATSLTNDMSNDGPGDNRQHDIIGQQREERETPSRSPPPET